MLNNETKYDKEIKLNSFSVKARKWRAKEKFAFKDGVMSKDYNIIESLVYNCLEKPVALSPDEYKYVLGQIRCHSIGETIKLEFYCDNCEKRFETELNINDILKPIYKEVKPIISKNHEIILGEIKNPDFYKKVISQAPTELDFYLRINKINDEEVFSIEEVVKYFNELDVDEFEDIISQWEDIRFKINDVCDVTCSHCSISKKYEFDEIPGFFPETWYN